MQNRITELTNKHILELKNSEEKHKEENEKLREENDILNSLINTYKDQNMRSGTFNFNKDDFNIDFSDLPNQSRKNRKESENDREDEEDKKSLSKQPSNNDTDELQDVIELPDTGMGFFRPREDTLDSKYSLMDARDTKRNSIYNISNARRGSFRLAAANGDELLVAEINELKTKMKLDADVALQKHEELMEEIDKKNAEISELMTRFTTTRKTDNESLLKNMEAKHIVEELNKEIKNIEAEKEVLREESDL